MPLPPSLDGRLRLPVVAAPMFLCSGPELVVACCRAGVLGTFPALNQRSTEGFEDWLNAVESQVGPADAPFGVNLIVHRSNERLDADLQVVVRHQVPVVITSLGAVPDVVEAVHSYGGVVFHDVTTRRHAEKAAEAGVDGLILVCAGAGGHAGTLSPFALLPEVREVFDGTILLAGGLSSGAQVAAALAMGADLAYMGTRFLATQECQASDAYKAMLTEARAADIVYTPALSGVPANYLRQSILAAGLDLDSLSAKDKAALNLDPAKRVWRDIWSAGQGVGAIADVPTTAALIDRLEQEYLATLDRMVLLAQGFEET
ncbi:MAG: nitronate monooxygenase family protein [Rhodospirillaceae bacterium]